MRAFKALVAFAFAVPVFSNPLLRFRLSMSTFHNPIYITPRQCAETCGSTCYSQDDINAAVQQGYGYYEDRTTVGSDKYPHQYEDYEGFSFPDAGPYYEFPVLSDEQVYTGGSPGADRVIFTADGTYEGVITHTGATGNDFLQSDFDMVMTGQYNIVNCGGNAPVVVNLLDELYASLLPVIDDAKSTTPSPAYKAFFKDPSSANLVSTLFTNITTGVPMTTPAPYSSNGAAAFLCVTAPEQFVYKIDGRHTDAYTDCLSDPAVISNYVAFIPPKQYIILCPSFFTSGIVSIPPPNTCLAVNMYTNGFLGNGQNIWLYKTWVLLGMLVHYYLYTSTGSIAVTNINDANKCLQLAAEQSSLNANNYIYYAAGVYGHCTAFPTPPTSGRQLLEIDIEDPSANGPDVASPDVVTYVATDLELGVEDTRGTP